MKESSRLESGFDPRRFASAQPIQLDLIHSRQQLPFHQRGREFVRGPIPLVWLHKAASLRGKALAVGIALWFKVGITKQREIKASNALWRKLGIHRKSAYRALAALERAGLVAVDRHAGRAPIVVILDLNASRPEEGEMHRE